jgi:small GTP-binding protein
MSAYFPYDVFVSCSKKDKAIVRPIAERLRAEGLSVWFDEWELQPGIDVAVAIENGLEHSRVLVLCVSANASGTEWVQLETGTFRFRDPLNSDRRFVTVRLDDAPIKPSLAQAPHVDWRTGDAEREYLRLLEGCRPPRISPSASLESQGELRAGKTFSLGHIGPTRGVAFSPDGQLAFTGDKCGVIRIWDVPTGDCLRVFEGHTDSIWAAAWSPDGRLVLSGADDRTLRLWEVESGRCLRVFDDGASRIRCVAWSPRGDRVLSGGLDNCVRIWNIESGRCDVLKGHSNTVWSVACSPRGQFALSGSEDDSLRLWDLKSGRCLHVLQQQSQTADHWNPHLRTVFAVAFSPDGRRALSGSGDGSLRLWQLEPAGSIRLLAGHRGAVFSVVWGSDGRHARSESADDTVRLWDTESGRCVRVVSGHAGRVRSVAWSPDQQYSLSDSEDGAPCVWDLNSGQCVRPLTGHLGDVSSLAFSPQAARALSGGVDGTVRLWDLESGRSLAVLEGHGSRITAVALSADGRRALSSEANGPIRLWPLDQGDFVEMPSLFSGRDSLALHPDGRHFLCSEGWDGSLSVRAIGSGRKIRELKGHSRRVLSVAWKPDGTHILSGSDDRTIRLWAFESGQCVQVLEGHSGSISSLAWSPDGRRALSADYTTGDIRVWDVDTGYCLRVLKGAFRARVSVAWGGDGPAAISVDSGGVARIWRVADAGLAAALDSPAAELSAPAHVHYTNAKVLLVGESGVGKTGLSRRLVENKWEPSGSTIGAWATHWPLDVTTGDDFEREIWLWDFGGQADQRLIHQLYMEDTALAVLVFDGQKEDLFETLGQWDRDLTRASRKTFAKLLAAGRVDAGGLRVSRSQIDKFAQERGFAGWLETSARQDIGCRELRNAIVAGIRWADIPWRSSPRLFKRLKDEIIRLKEEGRVLMRINELRDALRLRMSGDDAAFKDDELKAVVSLLAGPGVVWELEFGSWVLLQPERINAYAQAVIQTLRSDEDERGCLAEERVLRGELAYHSPLHRLEPEEERFVLLAMHQTLVGRSLCVREHTEKGPLLIFPAYYRRERPELVGHPAVLVTYRFSGFVDDIYTTLVVRLHHMQSFERDQLWRYAADFKTLGGKQVGVKLTRLAEGTALLDVYFDPTISLEEKIIFSRYVHEHLLQKGRDVMRLRRYVCPRCGTSVGNPEVAMRRLTAWLQPTIEQPTTRVPSAARQGDLPTIVCQECEERVPLWDDLEQRFADPTVLDQVRELQRQSTIVLDSESKERALVGDVISTVALAGQISRELTVSDHGIDMEIEFKSDAGRATARKLYLQLKSGDSYLRERATDGAEIFQIRDDRHARYWMDQAFPVLLVIRTSDGEVRWMEVRDYLRRAARTGETKHIVFDGERFDVMSVRRWRDRVLGAPAQGS